jgi:hypothetical protein
MPVNKLMACPFVKQVDLDNAESHTTGTKGVTLYTSYAYFYGFQYVGDPGMIKLGDKLQWNDGVQSHAYNVLACDTDIIDQPSASGPWVNDAHPEKSDPILFQRAVEGTNQIFGSWEFSSYWGNWMVTNRGPVDRNFAFDDASVRRVTDLALDKNEWDNLEIDDKRVDIVPAYTPQSASEVSRYHTWLPRN